MSHVPTVLKSDRSVFDKMLPVDDNDVLLFHLIIQFVSWCLHQPYAKNEDTQPIIFQNGFDVSVLKTPVSEKYLITYYIISNKCIF